MINSILTSVKKMLGITEDYEHFDADIITHINSVFSTLAQLGVGPVEGFEIHGSEETWDDFLGPSPLLNNVKTYMYLRVRMDFDPPQSSTTVNAYTSRISELEWRINVAVDPK